MKNKILNFITIICLIYSNGVYSYSAEFQEAQTLASTSPFNNPSSVRAMENFLSLNGALSGAGAGRVVRDLRVLFSQVLRDEPDGLWVFLNPNLKEGFVLSRNGMVHIYKDKCSAISFSPIKEYYAEKIKIRVYSLINSDIEILIKMLKENKDLITIPGVPDPQFTPEKSSDILRRQIIELLKREGVYKDSVDIRTLVDLVPEVGLKQYLKTLVRLVDELSSSSIVPLKYGEVKESLRNKDGTKPAGWLWMDGVYGLEEYDSNLIPTLLRRSGRGSIPRGLPRSSSFENKRKEVKNAHKIRDHIIKEGFRLKDGRHISSPSFPVDLRVWDGDCKKNEDFNNIISRNVSRLLSNLSEDEKMDLIAGIREHTGSSGIAVCVLDRSWHWGENCRGDRFVGVNRWLIEKIIEEIGALSSEINGQNREEEINLIKTRIGALEAYLQTCLYHELRHEAFIEEMKLKDDVIYEGGEEKFEEEIERRQNGHDAVYFVNVSNGWYEGYLYFLNELEILDMDSKFLHAVAIAGFAGEISVNGTENKHYNELIIEDFEPRDKIKLGIRVYAEYEKEYKKLFKTDKDKTELEWRGKMSYLLYKVGLCDHIRALEWREKTDLQRNYDYELAKKCIIRLIDFTVQHEFVPRAGRGSTFIRRDRPTSYDRAAQMLMVSLLSSGNYSQAVLRTELAFKTGGLVNTVTKDKFSFWKLAEEACKERVEKGDNRFKDITANMMKYVSIEKETLPKLRVLRLLERFLVSLPPVKFNKLAREDLKLLCIKYDSYLRENSVSFDDGDIDRFDRLYKKVLKILCDFFNVSEKEWGLEDDNLLIALWDSFDFADCLLGSLKKGEIDNIILLKDKELFDKDGQLKRNRDIKEETKERVSNVLKIYKDRIAKYRSGLNDILKRYGTSREVIFSKTKELLRDTRGWAGAVWLAREYNSLFKDSTIRNAIDMDSGLSVSYNALRGFGVPDEKLSGLIDHISDEYAEYFGDNPNKMKGDIANGSLKNIATEQEKTPESESFELISSIHKLHTVTSARKMFGVFKEVHRLLKYGGHFAITLPPERMFNEESLRAIKEKMGFVPVNSYGVVWNKLSEDAIKHLTAQYGSEEAERIISEMNNKRFYAIIFKKVAIVKEGEEELQDKSLLLPSVVNEKGQTRPVLHPPSVPISCTSAIKVLKPIPFIDWTSAETEMMGADLKDGITKCAEYKEKAERGSIIKEIQELIKSLLDSEIQQNIKLRDYTYVKIQENRIGAALRYKDSDYTKGVEKELFELYVDLDKYKNFVVKNYKDFNDMLEEIDKKKEFAVNFKKADEEKTKKVSAYGITDLSEVTLKEVKEMEELLRQEETRRQFAEQNWSRFSELQKILRKYQIFVKELMGGYDFSGLQKVLSADKETLSISIMERAIGLDVMLSGKFSTAKRRFADLRHFDSEVSKLFPWAECEFFFTSYDMDLLCMLRDEWSKEKIGHSGLSILKEMETLLGLTWCMEVVELWEVIVKDDINWDIGLASLLKGQPENEFVKILLYNRFISERGIRGEVINFTNPSQNEEIEEKLKGVPAGEDIVLSVSDGLNLTSNFIYALIDLGFEVRNIYEVCLVINEGINASPSVKQFIEMGKKIVILHRKNKNAISSHLPALTCKDTEMQDFLEWDKIRMFVLNSLNPTDLNIKTHSLLAEKQVQEIYPFLPLENLWKIRPANGFYYKNDVESVATDYKKRLELEEQRREEKEKKRIEREENLIKPQDKPLVGITYNGIWTESKVKDLAQILMRLIPDFSNPPLARDLADSPLITNHPLLGKLKKDELIDKIEELIKYRHYDLGIERVYRSLGWLAGALFSESKSAINYFIPGSDPSDKSRVADMLSLRWKAAIGEKPDLYVLCWNDYNLGEDPSPFGKDDEEWYNEILGNYLKLRCLKKETVKQMLGENFSTRELVVHVLRDKNKRLEQFSDRLCGLYISAGNESLKFERSILKEGADLLREYNEMLRKTHRLDKEEEQRRLTESIDKMTNVLRLYDKIKEVIDLLSKFYDRKNFKEEYLKDLEKYICIMLFLKTIDYETVNFIIENFKKLFEGRLTIDEYSDLKNEIEKRLKVDTSSLPQEDKTNVISKKEKLGSGCDSYNYFMHGEGMDNTLEVSQGDRILSKLAEGSVKVKHYYDALHLLNGVRLYNLSRCEKQVLDAFISKILSTEEDEALKEYTEQVICYLKAHNTVNRYLYFTYKTISKDKINLEDLFQCEPRLMVYAENGTDSGHLIQLLTELCRTKQMLNDPDLGSERLEIQLFLADLARIINLKYLDETLNKELSKMTEEMRMALLLKYEISAIGNLYCRDVITNVTYFLSNLRSGDQFLMQLLLITDVTGDELTSRMRCFVEEIFLYTIYFPQDKRIILENAAVGIATSIKYGVSASKAGLFLGIFKKFMPEEGRQLEQLVEKAKREKSFGINAAAISKYITDVIEDLNKTGDIPENFKKIMHLYQGARHISLIFFNEHYNKNAEHINRVRFQSAIDLAINSMENPYEFYLFYKTIITRAVCTGTVHLCPGIVYRGMTRIVEFIIRGKKDEVTDMLTNTYVQYTTMRDFVLYCIENSSDFRRYIAELFVNGDYEPASYAYEYILLYVSPDREYGFLGKGEERINKIHEILSCIVSGLLAKGDRLDYIKFRRAIYLFGVPLSTERGMIIQREWETIITNYKQGNISKETLIWIKNNAQKVLEEGIKAIKDPIAAEDVKKRFNLDILKREYVEEILLERLKLKDELGFLRARLDNIFKDAQGGKKIELTQVQLQRLLWLIDRSNEADIVMETARLIYLILDPNYTGDPGQVIMAIEKEILAYLYTEEQIEKENVRRNMSAIEIIVQRTVKGLRFSGRSLPKNIRNAVRFTDRFNLDRPSKTGQVHYVLIDEERAKNYKNEIEEIAEKCGVRFVTKIPEGVDCFSVVVLIDPEDALEYRGFKWYLPLIYSKKSFILAAWLAVNKPANIEGTQVFEFVKGFYENLFGIPELPDEEVLSWFKKPQDLKDKIKLLSADIRLLRFALGQLDKSA